MSQKGFTLVELLVAMAMSAVVTFGLVLSIFQVASTVVRNNTELGTLTDINNAVLWLKQDLQMAQTTSLIPEADPVSSVTASWTDYTGWATDETREHSVTYALSGTNLVRTYDGVAGVVGRNITSIGFRQNGTVIDCVVTATRTRAATAEETLEFSVNVHVRSEEVQ